MHQPIWYGTQAEWELLVDAVSNNCRCEFAIGGARTSTCEPHRMLSDDQRALNGLLFVGRIREQLLDEEFSVGTRYSRAELRAQPPGSGG
jgi:hypothetical protein